MKRFALQNLLQHSVDSLTLPQESNNLFPNSQSDRPVQILFRSSLCLNCAGRELGYARPPSTALAVKEDDMQYGSLIWAERRHHGPVWEYRWREPGPDGTPKHRRIVVGPVSQFEKREDALRAISALQRDINHTGKRQVSASITIRELFDHYRRRELRADNTSKTASTKHAYEGYITKWICPRWGSFPLARVRAGEVEQWLSLSSVGAGKLRQDPQHHERTLQPRHST
jgi:hypothetical protein